ncbi:hypothetical protein DTL21_23725 [Bremerella cremea]|uniref:Uncharacterized protein n=1 Tax=Blastopirellula marina TaxID=124 RepID=A0A2S8FE60_9BACT|nr:hypothetical protein C5Y83_23685 [Blastopirellula marina]RCS43722.1 hypothetical protein DTL21_23725 [Bremerella cremea]
MTELDAKARATAQTKATSNFIDAPLLKSEGHRPGAGRKKCICGLAVLFRNEMRRRGVNVQIGSTISREQGSGEIFGSMPIIPNFLQNWAIRAQPT